MADAAGTGRPGAGAAKEQLVRIGGRRLRITNLEKVLYPETGTTKGEVIDYYSRIGADADPARHRPPRDPQALARRRRHRGAPGQSFFAKDLERGAPEWVRRMPIPHSAGQGLSARRATSPRSSTSPRSRASSCTCRSGASPPTAIAGTPTGSCSTSIPGRASGSRSAPRSRAGRGTSSATWAWSRSR